MPPYNFVGVWEGVDFVGVVIFSRGANTHLGNPFGLKQVKVCELTRVALRHHKTPVSRILKIAIQFLRKQSPGIRLIVSFADQNQNHHGGIYQASGWIYTGETAGSSHFIDKFGRKWHRRQVSARGQIPQYGVMTPVPRFDQCTRVKELPKHRYLYPLDQEMRTKVLPLAKPYPKRVTSDTIDTAAVQAAEGGETPTVTLQKSA